MSAIDKDPTSLHPRGKLSQQSLGPVKGRQPSRMMSVVAARVSDTCLRAGDEPGTWGSGPGPLCPILMTRSFDGVDLAVRGGARRERGTSVAMGP